MMCTGCGYAYTTVGKNEKYISVNERMCIAPHDVKENEKTAFELFVERRVTLLVVKRTVCS